MITMGVEEIQPILAQLHREFKVHLTTNGPDIPFFYDIEYLHQHLENSHVPMEATLPVTPTSTTSFRQHTGRNNILPVANAAIGGHLADRYPPRPKPYRQQGSQRQDTPGNNNR